MGYRRILTIQDISCIGQCSMTVAMPILSACGHEVCLLPAAILSTHTGGFGKPAVQKLGDWMESAVAHWKENGILFDLVYVGYLGSLEAIRVAEYIMDTMMAPGGITVVDPALADHGKRYSGLDEAYIEAMFQLCSKADIMIPNMTEGAMMAGLPYMSEFDKDYVSQILDGIPGKNVLLTGVGYTAEQTGFAFREDGTIREHTHQKREGSYSGTGDIFASVFCGALASGVEPMKAGAIAARFVEQCIVLTQENPAHWYGVKFEPLLGVLSQWIREAAGE